MRTHPAMLASILVAGMALSARAPSEAEAASDKPRPEPEPEARPAKNLPGETNRQFHARMKREAQSCGGE